MLETALPEKGTKTHIIETYLGGEVVKFRTYCGHTHFEEKGEEAHSLNEIDNLCQNCKRRYIGL